MEENDYLNYVKDEPLRHIKMKATGFSLHLVTSIYLFIHSASQGLHHPYPEQGAPSQWPAKVHTERYHGYVVSIDCILMRVPIPAQIEWTQQQAPH